VIAKQNFFFLFFFKNRKIGKKSYSELAETFSISLALRIFDDFERCAATTS
jgi:hypothetical protein